AAWLGSRSAPSALITLSATLTQGAIDACRRLGEWPALVGIDDFPTAELLDVTVVDRAVGTMAAEAVGRLRGEPGDGGGRRGDGRVHDPEHDGEDRLGAGGRAHPAERQGGFPVELMARGIGDEPPETR